MVPTQGIRQLKEGFPKDPGLKRKRRSLDAIWQIKKQEQGKRIKGRKDIPPGSCGTSEPAAGNL